MAHDEKLAIRLREAIGERDGLSEKRMMGGVCFLIRGNMLSGASRDKASDIGHFMFRVGKEREAEALNFDGTQVMEHGGRRMGGLILIDEGDCDDATMQRLLSLARAFVSELPPK